jgi:hypothetical protein
MFALALSATRELLADVYIRPQNDQFLSAAALVACDESNLWATTFCSGYCSFTTPLSHTRIRLLASGGDGTSFCLLLLPTASFKTMPSDLQATGIQSRCSNTMQSGATVPIATQLSELGSSVCSTNPSDESERPHSHRHNNEPHTEPAKVHTMFERRAHFYVNHIRILAMVVWRYEVPSASMTSPLLHIRSSRGNAIRGAFLCRISYKAIKHLERLYWGKL